MNCHTLLLKNCHFTMYQIGATISSVRRQEFETTDSKLVEDILTSARIAHLGFIRDGQPELLPYNFHFCGEYVYFHCSPDTGLAGVVGEQVKMLAYHQVAWIPSTWRHPKLACPATTYYTSLSVLGTLEQVESVAEKAVVLEGFMKKYQPEDPYQPLSEDVYEGPLKALTVLKLKVENPVVKDKMGQHLTVKQRCKIFTRLNARSHRGDRVIAQAMMRSNPELATDGWVRALSKGQLRSLTELISASYWAKGRTLSEQARLNRDSEVIVAKVEGDEVLAFARVSWMTPSRAYLADVIVHPEHRGKGLGKEVMTRVMAHPKVEKTRLVMLVTRDAESLYEKYGFEEKYRDNRIFMSRAVTGS